MTTVFDDERLSDKYSYNLEINNHRHGSKISNQTGVTALQYGNNNMILQYVLGVDDTLRLTDFQSGLDLVTNGTRAQIIEK